MTMPRRGSRGAATPAARQRLEQKDNDVSVTETLAAHLFASRAGDIPSDVWHEAKRALLNCLGCGLGGSREPAVEVALRALSPYSGERVAPILGRSERLDPLHASLINGICVHVHEYDDTTPKNYIHPSPPVASALFAHAGAHRVSGADFLHAFVLGFEAECRIGNAVYPAHYEAGWHITATTGVFGAAAAIGKLLGLETRQMVWALGLAATQAAGLREMFGSMAKSFHAGRAAQNGYASAILARADFTAGEHALEGPRGFAAVQASEYDLTRVTHNLGRDFELRDNAYKPYPCGLVVHPTIDGAIELHDEHRPAPRDIAAVTVRVAPLVLDLCNKRDFTRALQSKYSIYHAAAIGLVRGKAGLAEFKEEAVGDPDIAHVRDRVTAVADAGITEDQASIEVELASGEKLTKFVRQSLGNVHRPLSDRQLEDKFRDQAVLVLPEQRVEAIIEQCWRIDELTDVGEIVRAAVPEPQAVMPTGSSG
jgi:2-methylcitrate dehydratase PrpD